MFKAIAQDVKEYWDDVVMKYNLDDLNVLTEWTRDKGKAGPLLLYSVAMIDMLGGMFYGFGAGVGARTKRFTTNHLYLDSCKSRLITTEQADVLYDSFRNGIAHQGTTKSGVCFTVAKSESENLLVLEANRIICLNVMALATQLINKISSINDAVKNETDEYLQHAPPTKLIDSISKAQDQLAKANSAVPGYTGYSDSSGSPGSSGISGHSGKSTNT